MIWLIGFAAVIIVAVAVLVLRTKHWNGDPRQQSTAKALVSLANAPASTPIASRWRQFLDEFENRYRDLPLRSRGDRLVHALSMVRTALHPESYHQLVGLARSYYAGLGTDLNPAADQPESFISGDGMPIYISSQIGDPSGARVCERALSQDRFTSLDREGDTWFLRVDEPEGSWEMSVKMQAAAGLRDALIITDIRPVA